MLSLRIHVVEIRFEHVDGILIVVLEQEDEVDRIHAGAVFEAGPVRDGNRPVERISEDSARDGGEGDCLAAVLLCELERFAVAAGQELLALLLAELVEARADGMDDVSGRQVAAVGDFRVAWPAASQVPALRIHLVGAGGHPDCPVDASAAKQPLVRRVHDCVGVGSRDVAEYDPDVRAVDCVRLIVFHGVILMRSYVFYIWQYISADRYGRLSIPNS